MKITEDKETEIYYEGYIYGISQAIVILEHELEKRGYIRNEDEGWIERKKKIEEE